MTQAQACGYGNGDYDTVSQPGGGAAVVCREVLTRGEPAERSRELILNRSQFEGIAEMAGDKVFLADILVFRHLVAAKLFGVLAPGMKVAAGRGIDRTGNIPFEPDPMGLVIGVRDGDGRHQRLRIGMLWI